MECLKCFSDGYRRISEISNEDSETYEDVKEDYEEVATNWKDLETKTREQIIEIKDYFQKCLISQKGDEATIKKAKEFGESMDEYSKKIYKIDASIRLDPQKADARISLLEERIQRFQVHGLRFGVAGIILLACFGAVTAWQLFGAKPVKIVLGGAVGLACGILPFLIFYHGFLALERKKLSKWEELKKRITDTLELVAEIKQKRPITREISTLLMDVKEVDMILYASQEIVSQCEEYLAIR